MRKRKQAYCCFFLLIFRDGVGFLKKVFTSLGVMTDFVEGGHDLSGRILQMNSFILLEMDIQNQGTRPTSLWQN